MHKRSDELRKQFYVTTGKLEKIEKGFRLKLDDDPVVGISAADRRAVSDPKGEFAQKDLWRWGAGGALVVYRQDGKSFLALPLRDDGAPSFGGHLTLTSGLSSSFEEFFNPTFIAIREGIEEVAVLVGKNVVAFSLGPAFEQMAWDVFEKQLIQAKKFNWSEVDDAPFYADAEFISTNEQKLEIVHGKRISRHEGIICLDPKTRGIDLLKIILVNLPSQSETVFFDCEDSKTGPIDREIIVFPLNGLKSVNQEGAVMKICGATKKFKSGKSLSADPEKLYPCTPVLEEALKVLLSM